MKNRKSLILLSNIFHQLKVGWKNILVLWKVRCSKLRLLNFEVGQGFWLDRWWKTIRWRSFKSCRSFKCWRWWRSCRYSYAWVSRGFDSQEWLIGNSLFNPFLQSLRKTFLLVNGHWIIYENVWIGNRFNRRCFSMKTMICGNQWC